MKWPMAGSEMEFGKVGGQFGSLTYNKELKTFFGYWCMRGYSLIMWDRRWSWRKSQSADCERCGGGSEDVNYAVRDCNISRELLEFLIPTDLANRLFSSCLKDWLIQVSKMERGSKDDISWPEKMAITFWWQWKWHNDEFFNGRTPLPQRISYLVESFKETNIAQKMWMLHDGSFSKSVVMV